MFSDKEVNTGRQPEMDLAKAVIIFLLASIHMYVACSTEKQLWTGLPYFFDSIAGGPWAAPMFIFSMGIGLAYTKKNTARDLFWRGLKLGGVGILLNVCRFLIPSLVGFAISGDYEMYLEKLPYLFSGNDLLQFSALALLLMALLRYLCLSPWKIWFAALGLNLAAMALNNSFFDNMAVNVILGHLIGIDDGTEMIMSDFPLLIWFLVYATGYVAGGYYRRLKDKGAFYRIVTLPCLMLAVIVCVDEYRRGYGMMGGPGANVFYHFTTPELFVCIAAEFGMLGIYYAITRHLPRRALRVIESISRNVTVVYFIQWVLVWWTANVFIYLARGSKYMEPGQILIPALLLSLLSVILAEAWSRRGTLKSRRASQ